MKAGTKVPEPLTTSCRMNVWIVILRYLLELLVLSWYLKRGRINLGENYLAIGFDGNWYSGDGGIVLCVLWGHRIRLEMLDFLCVCDRMVFGLGNGGIHVVRE